MSMTNPARGMRDFLPADVRKREYVIGIIKEVYESYGFEPLEDRETSFGKQVDESNKTVEVEAICIVSEILVRLGISDFIIRLNHQDVLISILDTVGISEDHHQAAILAISQHDKADFATFAESLLEIGISEDAANMLVEIFIQTQEILNQDNEVNRTIVSNLINIVNNETLTELGQVLSLSGKVPVLIDPTLANDPQYSSGLLIAASISGIDKSIGIGGHYLDDEPISAFGFSFDLDNIFGLLEDGEMFHPELTVVNSATTQR